LTKSIEAYKPFLLSISYTSAFGDDAVHMNVWGPYPSRLAAVKKVEQICRNLSSQQKDELLEQGNTIVGEDQTHKTHYFILYHDERKQWAKELIKTL
jgi:hypothetical protein